MIKKYIFAYILSLCLLTGCDNKMSEKAPDVLPVINFSEETKAKTTAQHTDISETQVYTTPPSDLNLIIDNTLEVYDNITIGEVISNSQIQLKNSNDFIDTSKIGKQKTIVSYLYKDKLYNHQIEYTVADTTPPIVLNSGGGTALIGSEFNLSEFVGFADNYDPSPELTYEGYVDTSTYGDYPITAIATDSSGNETQWELCITVSDEEPPYEDNNDRLSFNDFINDYADENVAFGIDVSRWQGEIDFEAVKKAGCSFVIMRIGTYYDEYTLDQYYLSNMQAAKDAGLDVGVYIYTTANTKNEILDNADWIIEQLDGQQLDFPIVFDWENFTNFQQYNMSINDLNEYFEIFSNRIEENGYSSMLYSSKNFLNNFWYEHSDYPIWLAHYTEQTDYTGEYAMWQMSCFGNIDGIEGDVDFNILYKDKIIW